MEGNGSRKLSWIAIALGGLALFVALSGRMESHGGRFNESQGYDRAPAFQAGPGAPGAPQGQFDPRGQVGPQDQAGPRGQFDPRDQEGPRGGFGPHDGFEGKMRWGGPRHGFPFFFLPFMLFGGLLKIAFVILLVMLGLRLIRGGGRGPWGRGGGRGQWGHGPESPPSDQTPPSRPGPEQPPYTGDTQQM
ncbi:MAG: hypothetical protein ABIV47_10140 [Roseiflexaceae bacterium]